MASVFEADFAAVRMDDLFKDSKGIQMVEDAIFWNLQPQAFA